MIVPYPPDEQASYTYAQTLAAVKKFANVLKSKGIKKGDTVTIYMPMVYELSVACLACARIGAVHSVVFGGFSPEARPPYSLSLSLSPHFYFRST